MKQTLLFLCLLAAVPCSAAYHVAVVDVFGTMTCKNKPYVNQTVSLYEKNYLTSDSLVWQTTTDENGFWKIKDSAMDRVFQPMLYIHIANFCEPSFENWFMHCGTNVQVTIPDWATSQGASAVDKPYNMTMEMTTVKSDYFGFEWALFGTEIFDDMTCDNKPGQTIG